jgi:hypothetical protein
MDPLTALSLSPRQLVIAYAAYWLLGALASTMPSPTPESSVWYVWVHNILQFVSANMTKMQTRQNWPPAQRPPADKEASK